MATTKKKRPAKKKVVSSSPAAAAKEPSGEIGRTPVEPKVEVKKVPTRSETKNGRVFHIHLIGGARLVTKGFDFVAGRPLITTDEKVYEKFQNNGRFRIDIREGGA